MKRYIDDPSLPAEERYKRLEQHHKEETELLAAIIKGMLAGNADDWVRAAKVMELYPP